MELLFITKNKKQGEMAIRTLLTEKPYWNASHSKAGPEASKKLQDKDNRISKKHNISHLEFHIQERILRLIFLLH